ncbi:uncharacterized protein LOC122328102 [Puntigrus tetrazona]|uniref:uncharacterized protein LOC122328102 n=1 Tax=Puntigrus tetrazona TaxID=1606681 RepID=UPI001C8981D8|nr:uncharacterized protein LOC122328102 [Puntigrus tetrazona]
MIVHHANAACDLGGSVVGGFTPLQFCCLQIIAAGFIRSDTEQLKKMLHVFVLLCLGCYLQNGVFGESVSVTEGDSVTLYTGVTEIREGDDILWKYGAELITKIKKRRNSSPSYTFDRRFSDRLKVDHQTGSLTITNITTRHAGDYQLEITGVNLISKTFSVSIYNRLPVPAISSNSSQCSSTSSSSSPNCSLLCSVVNVGHVTLSWYKGNSLLSSISVSDLSISLSLPLEVEYQDKNTYSCVINNPIRNQTTHLDISQLCHTCSVSVSLIALISAAGSLLIIVAIVVICCICRKGIEKSRPRRKAKPILHCVKRQKKKWYFSIMLHKCFTSSKEHCGNSLLLSAIAVLNFILFLLFSTSYVNEADFRPCATSEALISEKCDCFPGVFSESVSAMEGDSVTLYTGDNKMHEGDDILWKYEAGKSHIAKIKKTKHIVLTYNDTYERFRDRLKLDDQTGSLTIMNISTQHAGEYQVEISGAKITLKTFSISVYARLPVPVISSNSSNCSSSSSNCSLLCSVVNVGHVTLSWYKGNSLLSSISVSDLSISLSLPLEVEYQDKNTYSCVINNPIRNQTTHLNISQLCHTCSVPLDSVSLIVLISVSAGSLLLVAALGIFCICKKHRKTDQEVETCEEEIIYAETTFNKRVKRKSFGSAKNEMQSVMEGDCVTLNTDVTEIHEVQDIFWKYRDENSLLAKLNIEIQMVYTYDDVLDGRFRDRLKLDHQTGSLTITNISTLHAGEYQVEISGVKATLKTFTVSVYAHLPIPNITRDFSQNLSSSASSSSSSTSCSLLCSVVNVGHVTLSWYKGNSLLSSISVSDLSISLSLPLEVEYQDKNTYSCVINNPIRNQTTHLDISQLCQISSAPVYLIALTSAGFLLILAAVGIFCICRKYRKNDQEVLRADDAADQNHDKDIIYTDLTFYRRNPQTVRATEDSHVVYAPICMRR